MDERIRFVIRLKDGESMAALCREFQISRKTGYKIFERYEECGLEGLTARARRSQGTTMRQKCPTRLGARNRSKFALGWPTDESSGSNRGLLRG